MKKKLERIILAGKGCTSFCIKEDANGIEKQKTIGEYRALLISDNDYTVASEVTNDRISVDYEDDHIRGIFRYVNRDGKITVVPFHGLFCAVWFESKKTTGKIRFLWCFTGEDQYQFTETSCIGIEQEAVMLICDMLFTHLKDQLGGKIVERINDIKGFSGITGQELEEE